MEQFGDEIRARQRIWSEHNNCGLGAAASMGSKKNGRKAPGEGGNTRDYPKALITVVAAYHAFISVLGKVEPDGVKTRSEAALCVEEALRLQPSGAGCYLLVRMLPGIGACNQGLHSTDVMNGMY